MSEGALSHLPPAAPDTRLVALSVICCCMPGDSCPFAASHFMCSPPIDSPEEPPRCPIQLRGRAVVPRGFGHDPCATRKGGTRAVPGMLTTLGASVAHGVD